MPDDKTSQPMHKSRVLWFNGIAGLIGLLAPQIEMLMPFMGPGTYTAMYFTVITVNYILRYYTSLPIEGSAKDVSGG